MKGRFGGVKPSTYFVKLSQTQASGAWGGYVTEI